MPQGTHDGFREPFGSDLRWRQMLAPVFFQRSKESVQNLYPRSAEFAAQTLTERISRRLTGRGRAICGPVRQRINRQQVDPGTGAVHAIRAAESHAGSEGLNQPQRTEVVHLHLVTRSDDAVPIHRPTGAYVFGGIDQDVDFAADFARQLLHRNAVGHVEGHDLDIGNSRQFVGSSIRPPGLGNTNEDKRRPGRGNRLGHGLAERRASVGDEHPAMFRIAGQLPQLLVIRHIGSLLFRQSHKDPLTRFIRAGDHAQPSALRHVTMDMCQHRDPRIQLNGPGAPGRAFPEIDVGAGLNGGFRNQPPSLRHLHPLEVHGEALRAGFTRRIGHCVAIATFLQGKAPLGSRDRETKGLAAARGRRQGRQNGAFLGVFARRTLDRIGHAFGPARTAAPEHSPRS